MNQRNLIIKRFALGPLAQWGFIAGALIACAPAFACSWIFFGFVQSLRGTIAGWRDVGFEILGQRLSFNLVEMLQLQGVFQSLTALSAWGVFGIFLLALGVAALLGIFGALVMTVLGLFYNTTGRLEIQVEEVSQADLPAP